MVVSMTRGKSHLNIVVEDQGVGIAESAIPNLFDPFDRTDSSRSRKTGGFGLGLMKLLIKAHAAEVTKADCEV